MGIPNPFLQTCSLAVSFYHSTCWVCRVLLVQVIFNSNPFCTEVPSCTHTHPTTTTSPHPALQSSFSASWLTSSGQCWTHRVSLSSSQQGIAGSSSTSTALGTAVLYNTPIYTRLLNRYENALWDGVKILFKTVVATANFPVPKACYPTIATNVIALTWFVPDKSMEAVTYHLLVF